MTESCVIRPWPPSPGLSRAVFRAVDHHRQGERLADDLTVLVLSRPIVPPVPTFVPAV